jgi:hypothetical protein
MGAAVAGEEKLNRALGKLVLFLADGTTLDIPLDHERVTVGRRSGNDVCLPYPAVSAAHAVFVTTATGVVMEDLCSTNGTAVNGMRASKQVLHDGDRIDIGRQRLVYLADASAMVPPSAPKKSAGRRAGDNSGGDDPEGERRSVDMTIPAHEYSAAARAERALAIAPAPAEAPVATMLAAAAESWLSRPCPNGSADAGNPGVRIEGSPGAPNATAPSPGALHDAPILKVRTGPSAGRSLALTMDEALIGRVGRQVVAVRKADNGYRLLAAEGSVALRVNGVAVPPEGVLLQSDDAIEIAGAQLVFLKSADEI